MLIWDVTHISKIVNKNILMWKLTIISEYFMFVEIINFVKLRA
jgi:hypothetical protein